ncbi:hypothetical protein D3C81_2051000 [compost metagenome]
MPGSPRKLTEFRPKKFRAILANPSRGARNSIMMETITTVEIKYGANETSWTNRLNLPPRISLIISASRIGIGNPASSR